MAKQPLDVSKVFKLNQTDGNQPFLSSPLEDQS